MFAATAVDRGFEPRSNETKDYEIGTQHWYSCKIVELTLTNTYSLTPKVNNRCFKMMGNLFCDLKFAHFWNYLYIIVHIKFFYMMNYWCLFTVLYFSFTWILIAYWHCIMMWCMPSILLGLNCKSIKIKLSNFQTPIVYMMLNPKPQILVKQENHYVSVESVRFRTSISCQKSLTIPKQI